MRFSWTQPICEACWVDREHGLPAVRLKDPAWETCAICGEPTRDGVYFRVDPSTVPVPTMMRDEPGARHDAGTPGPQAA
jgi:hypothetical protein